MSWRCRITLFLYKNGVSWLECAKYIKSLLDQLSEWFGISFLYKNAYPHGWKIRMMFLPLFRKCIDQLCFSWLHLMVMWYFGDWTLKIGNTCSKIWLSFESYWNCVQFIWSFISKIHHFATRQTWFLIEGVIDINHSKGCF